MSESHVSVPELLPWKGRALCRDGAAALVNQMQIDGSFDVLVRPWSNSGDSLVICCINPAAPSAVMSWQIRLVLSNENRYLHCETWTGLIDSLSFFYLINAYKEI